MILLDSIPFSADGPARLVNLMLSNSNCADWLNGVMFVVEYP